MKPARSSIFASALLTSCIVGASLVGCSAGADATQEAFEVSSDAQAGLLARIDFDDGGYVEFVRDEDGGIFIVSVFEKTGFNPLRGVELSRALPSKLFEHLTKHQAPAELIAAEHEAGLLSSPEALAMQQPSSGAEEIGTASSALTEAAFSATHCGTGFDFCGLGARGNRTVSSGGRVKRAAGTVDVLEGSLRLRVLRARAGTDETLSTRVVSAGFLAEFSNATPGIKRRMRVVVDQADDAVYHLAVNFSG